MGGYAIRPYGVDGGRCGWDNRALKPNTISGGFLWNIRLIYNGEEIGRCVLRDLGLYWELLCRCQAVSDQVERLYCGEEKLGVLQPSGGELALKRRISKASCPALPPEDGQFSLSPAPAWTPWTGRILGYDAPQGLSRRDGTGETLQFPYDPDGPCPCPPLFCLFSVEDGFWRLRLDRAGAPVVSSQ